MIRKHIRLTGIVQGVGFRPFLRNLACDCRLTGWVHNDSSGVTIEIQGPPERVAQFLDRLPSELPPLARIDQWVTTPADPIDESQFVIRPSPIQPGRSTPISPDIAPCTDCLREFHDPNDRRYHYPFINCTHCGPRFTIVRSVPYDRTRTTMQAFAMCGLCRKEYEDPSNRRYHAQPNACPECGPTIWFVDDLSNASAFDARPDAIEPRSLTGRAMEHFHHAIARGQIVAVKGIGGFHLACDATHPSAVARLRRRKGRIDKPFAIMVRDAEQARQIAHLNSEEQALLESPQRPIVLLTKIAPRSPDCVPVGERERSEPVFQRIGDDVAPGNDFIGVMLPYSPLHELLVRKRPLVMTSGNRSDEPIARTNREARERLGELADAFLLHDRPIEVVCDDSVVRQVQGNLLPVRRSRGYAPLPIRLPTSGPSVLAVGGEIKSTFCLTRDDYAYLSQHMGDMGNLETLEALRRSINHFGRLFQVAPRAIVADLHPGYLSGQWAERLAESQGVPLIRVQHHWAHVVSLAAEHGWRFETGNPLDWIGCCFDGTGYGTDGTIWGGEFLTGQPLPESDTPPAPESVGQDGNRGTDVSRDASFRRLAHLAPFPLPGGDASIRHPWRTALALLWHHGIEWNERLPAVAACPDPQRQPFRQQLERNVNCVRTSSMGRLFDAVASLIGVRHAITYEAQAAMEMEAMASRWFAGQTGQSVNKSFTQFPDCSRMAEYERTTAFYAFALGPGWPITIDAAPVLRAICDDVLAGGAPTWIAARFHLAVANMIVDVCDAIRQQTGLALVGLTGGVFQNVLLLQLASQRLRAAGFEVRLHEQVPPNDAGIALGQAIVGRQ